jgi:hypothetical protein
MKQDTWIQMARAVCLPHDAEPLVVKPGYAVARSVSRRLVFRIGRQGSRSFDLNPSDVSHAHRIAVDMERAGLNVLAPTTREPEVCAAYLISASPLATPLLDARWSSAEAVDLGEQLRAWSSYRSPLLTTLDIPDYVRARANQAIHAGGEVAAAGEWCMRELETLEFEAPFSELFAGRPGAIHGDVHPGNLVRYQGRILLIDLDSVKMGPAMFDVAVALMYERRYNRDYPGTLMASGYLDTTLSLVGDELTALQKWKELSSYSQLILRWEAPGISTEFWQRTQSEWNDKWTNIVGTPTQGTCDRG